MEKGQYLVYLLPTSDEVRMVRLIEIYEITGYCYRIYENSQFYWLLKEDFDKKYKVIEKLIKKEEPKNEKKRWFRK